MFKMINAVKSFFRKDGGASFLEYSLLILAIGVFVVVAGGKLVTHLGGSVSSTNTQIDTNVTDLQTKVNAITIN